MKQRFKKKLIYKLKNPLKPQSINQFKHLNEKHNKGVKKIKER